MNATTANHISTLSPIEVMPNSDEHRALQSSLLSELPGVVFGLLTILYIVTCFAQLV